jgi:3-phenylpropionate/trans-cinnamate dioxygenase ferredoxin subunit
VKFDVGCVEEFREGLVKIVDVKGREIGVLMWDGIPYAVRNACPHQAGPVCAGIVSRKIASDHVGELRLDRETPVLTCPWHAWEFDVRTGQLLADPTQRVKTYRAEVNDGRIMVSVGRAEGE